MSDPKILDGKSISESIIESVGLEIQHITSIHNHVWDRNPILEIIMVGNNPASETYVKNKIKACRKAGIETKISRYSETITTEKLISDIRSKNVSDIDGLIVQLPLPSHLEVNSIINSIDEKKDVDGFHPTNFGKMALGLPSLKPATPYGILKLIKGSKIDTKGKHVVVVGRSNIVGKPISIMLGNDFEIGRATVTSCDINTPPELLKDELIRADIIIIAVGKEGFLKGDMVKDGAVVIDVGINKTHEGKIVGDVDWESVYPKVSKITPVPGGVGPMTIAALIINTMNSWKGITR
jgi:methylenetetrahydrofolate dehydrogenase (NADP+)/methenyltetrahydrofolate cyclohydrolase